MFTAKYARSLYKKPSVHKLVDIALETRVKPKAIDGCDYALLTYKDNKLWTGQDTVEWDQAKDILENLGFQVELITCPVMPEHTRISW